MKCFHSSVERQQMWLAVVAALLAIVPGNASAADIDRPPINYGTDDGNNVITKLLKRVEAGKANLDHDHDFGYLPALLRELKVPKIVASARVLQNQFATAIHLAAHAARHLLQRQRLRRLLQEWRCA
jgi:hypothetical protein